MQLRVCLHSSSSWTTKQCIPHIYRNFVVQSRHQVVWYVFLLEHERTQVQLQVKQTEPECFLHESRFPVWMPTPNCLKPCWLFSPIQNTVYCPQRHDEACDPLAHTFGNTTKSACKLSASGVLPLPLITSIPLEHVLQQRQKLPNLYIWSITSSATSYMISESLISAAQWRFNIPCKKSLSGPVAVVRILDKCVNTKRSMWHKNVP